MHRLFPTFLSLILLSSLSASIRAAENQGIARADNLQAVGQLAARSDRPILLMISQQHCTYCERMKREILDPMILGGDYKKRILMREILIDKGEQLSDFHGRRQSAAAFAKGYGVRLTPTLLFLDPQGKELAERIVGINTLEMFSFYLDAAIDEATAKMQP